MTMQPSSIKANAANIAVAVGLICTLCTGMLLCGPEGKVPFFLGDALIWGWVVVAGCRWQKFVGLAALTVCLSFAFEGIKAAQDRERSRHLREKPHVTDSLGDSFTLCRRDIGRH